MSRPAAVDPGRNTAPGPWRWMWRAGLAVYLICSGLAFAFELADSEGVAMAGLHGEELAAGGGRPFSWSAGERAWLRMPVAGPSLRLPVFMSRPDAAFFPREVVLSVGGRRVDETLFPSGGWGELTGFLPPLLGAADWRRVEEAWARLERLPRSSRFDGAFDARWRPLLGRSPRDGAILEALWRDATRPGWPLAPALPGLGLPTVDVVVTVDGSFVPSEQAPEVADGRRLGVGVGRPLWSDAFTGPSFGMHAEEEDAAGRRFRWSGRTGSIRVRVRDRVLELPLRVDHPDVAGRPVRVSLFWGSEPLSTVSFSSTEWQTVRLGPDVFGSETTGILTVEVDRVWNPALEGDSRDSRFLGVAVGARRWVPDLPGDR